MIGTMHFNNPVFHDGENLTVRRGIKWASAYEGCVILAPDIKGAIIVRRVIVMPFKELACIDIPMLASEHDPACRTYDGLLETMREIYPDFIEQEIVTLVFFEIKK
jgi:hypothetical protein